MTSLRKKVIDYMETHTGFIFPSKVAKSLYVKQHGIEAYMESTEPEILKHHIAIIMAKLFESEKALLQNGGGIEEWRYKLIKK